MEEGVKRCILVLLKDGKYLKIAVKTVHVARTEVTAYGACHDVLRPRIDQGTEKMLGVKGVVVNDSRQPSTRSLRKYV
jgi:hypothetical protein